MHWPAYALFARMICSCTGKIRRAWWPLQQSEAKKWILHLRNVSIGNGRLLDGTAIDLFV